MSKIEAIDKENSIQRRKLWDIVEASLQAYEAESKKDNFDPFESHVTDELVRLTNKLSCHISKQEARREAQKRSELIHTHGIKKLSKAHKPETKDICLIAGQFFSAIFATGLSAFPYINGLTGNAAKACHGASQGVQAGSQATQGIQSLIGTSKQGKIANVNYEIELSKQYQQDQQNNQHHDSQAEKTHNDDIIQQERIRHEVFQSFTQ